MKQTSFAAARFNLLRSLVGRFAFLTLIAVSFGLMLVGKADTLLAERVRTVVADSLAPVLDVLARPAVTVSSMIENVRELTSIREENARLREENARLLHWQAVAHNLEAQNDAFRNLLNFSADPGVSFVSARVVADMGGAYAQSLLITAGTRDQVEKGQAVISGEGLVGRIVETGRRASRAILLTDINSRIPVSVGNSRQRAILAGDNTQRPRLLFLKTIEGVAPGDRVVTSGDSGVFPQGLPVGVVSLVDDTEVRVEPYVQRDRLEYVRVVNYDLPGILREISGPRRPETLPLSASGTSETASEGAAAGEEGGAAEDEEAAATGEPEE